MAGDNDYETDSDSDGWEDVDDDGADLEGWDPEHFEALDPQFHCDGCDQAACLLTILGVLFGKVEKKDADDAVPIDEALGALESLSQDEPHAAGPHMPQLAQCVLHVLDVGYPNLDQEVRAGVIDALCSLAENAPAVVRATADVVDRVLPALAAATGNVDLDVAWGAADTAAAASDPMSLDDEAAAALDRLSVALGGSYVISAVTPSLMEWFTSDDPKEKIAALTTITAICEGSVEGLKPHLDQVIAATAPLITDGHPRVRWTACGCIGQLAKDFEGEPLSGDFLLFPRLYHAQVMPGLMLASADSENPRVQAHALSALSNFAEDMDTDSLQFYLNAVLLQLGGLLSSEHRIVLEGTLTALAAIASSNDGIFKDAYREFHCQANHVGPKLICAPLSAAHFMPPLVQVLGTPPMDSTWRVLRGKAVECVTLIALSVGKEMFAGDAAEVVGLLDQILSELEEYDVISEYLYTGYSRLCEVMKEDFSPTVTTLVPHLLSLLTTNAEVRVLHHPNEVDALPGGEDVWDIMQAGPRLMAIDTRGLSSRDGALIIVGAIARECGNSLVPYLPEIVPVVMKGLSSLAGSMKESAAIAASDLLKLAVELPDDDEMTAAKVITLDLFDSILRCICDRPLECEDLLESVNEILQLPKFNLASPNSVVQMLELILTNMNGSAAERELFVQDNVDEADMRSAMEEASNCQEIGSIVVDVLDGLFEKVGLPLTDVGFKSLQPHFMTLVQKRPLHPSDHQTSFLAWSVLVDKVGPAALEYIEEGREVLLSHLADTAIEPAAAAARQAAVYLVGSLAKNGEGVFEDILKHAAPLVLEFVRDVAEATTPTMKSAIENAAAAGLYVARFVPSAGIDLDEALPVLIPLLPFVEDLEEAPEVYVLISEMLLRDDYLAHFSGSDLSVVLGVFAENVDVVEIRNHVAQLRADKPDLVEEAVSALDETTRQAFYDRFGA